MKPPACSGFSADRGHVRPCRSSGIYPDDAGKLFCLRHHPRGLRDRLSRMWRRGRFNRAEALAEAYGTTVIAELQITNVERSQAAIREEHARLELARLRREKLGERVTPPITAAQLSALERLELRETRSGDRWLIRSALGTLRRAVHGEEPGKIAC